MRRLLLLGILTLPAAAPRACATDLMAITRRVPGRPAAAVGQLYSLWANAQNRAETRIIAARRMPPQVNCALPPGFELDQYRIHSQLSLGGFSIVYLADDRDNTPVAIKEYLPNALALREEGHIQPKIPEEFLPAFRYGMKCFFEEGRTLAGLNHPNVVRALNFFRANETVYMVMDYEEGWTLQQYIQRRQKPVSENFLRNVFTRVLNGLREVHTHRILPLRLPPVPF